MLTVLFDGISYGMLLFVLACGLAVTLGLMNFVNLAHGAFAMAGGYITVVLVNRLGVPFALGVVLALQEQAEAPSDGQGRVLVAEFVEQIQQAGSQRVHVSPLPGAGQRGWSSRP